MSMVSSFQALATLAIGSSEPSRKTFKEALIYSHTCIRQQVRFMKLMSGKLFVQLALYQSQSAKTLLSHPFGAWLLLFPGFVAALDKGITIACERRRTRKQN